MEKEVIQRVKHFKDVYAHLDDQEQYVETSKASESFWVADFKNTIDMRSYEV